MPIVEKRIIVEDGSLKELTLTETAKVVLTNANAVETFIKNNLSANNITVEQSVIDDIMADLNSNNLIA